MLNAIKQFERLLSDSLFNLLISMNLCDFCFLFCNQLFCRCATVPTKKLNVDCSQIAMKQMKNKVKSSNGSFGVAMQNTLIINADGMTMQCNDKKIYDLRVGFKVVPNCNLSRNHQPADNNELNGTNIHKKLRLLPFIMIALLVVVYLSTKMVKKEEKCYVMEKCAITNIGNTRWMSKAFSRFYLNIIYEY